MLCVFVELDGVGCTGGQVITSNGLCDTTGKSVSHSFQEKKNTFQVSLINNNTDGPVTVFFYLGNAASRQHKHLLYVYCRRISPERKHLFHNPRIVCFKVV